MKGNLVQREPEFLKNWDKEGSILLKLEKRGQVQINLFYMMVLRILPVTFT